MTFSRLGGVAPQGLRGVHQERRRLVRHGHQALPSQDLLRHQLRESQQGGFNDPLLLRAT